MNNYTLQCPNYGTADNQDFDCDGVINSADLDDDNDGVLDTQEDCKTIRSQTSDADLIAATTLQPQLSSSTYLHNAGTRQTSIEDLSFTVSKSAIGNNNSNGLYWNNGNPDELAIIAGAGQGWEGGRLTFSEPVSNFTLKLENLAKSSFTTSNITSNEQAAVRAYDENGNVIFSSGGGYTYTQSGVYVTEQTDGDLYVRPSANNRQGSINITYTTPVKYIDLSTINAGNSGGSKVNFSFHGGSVVLEEQGCTVNTDNDSFSNRFDPDSDGDGCSDAYEAGATTNLSSDYRFAGTPDSNANGLNDNIEDGTTGNINYTSTYNTHALNAGSRSCEGRFLWLRADRGISAADGGSVTTWNDQSGQRTNDAASSGEVAPPVYRANASDYINFNPVVEFDGTDDGLNYGSDYPFATGQGTTWLAVVKPDATVSKTLQFIFDFGFYTSFGYGLAYGSENIRFYTPTDHAGGTTGFSPLALHNRGTATTLIREVVVFQNTQRVSFDGAGTSAFFDNIPDMPALGDNEISQSATHQEYTGPFTIGRQSKNENLNTKDNGRFFDGRIAELIGFDRPLNEDQIRRHESYLAIKYGITLDNKGGNVNGDYLSMTGTLLWDASAYAAYHHNVAGIGRDDANSFSQKQSVSINPGAIVTIGLDADTNGLEAGNAANSSTFAANNSFLIWGHDNAPIENVTNREYNTSQVNSRLNREWKVKNTGNVGALTVTFDVSQLPGPSGHGSNSEDNIVLLVDEDGNFSSGATMVHQSYIKTGDGKVNFSATLPDGAYFTLGSMEEKALPVTLVNFNATLVSEGVELEWSTASEINHNHFVVERSADGRNFKDIGLIQGSGNSTVLKKYTYLDGEVGPGQTYYRLRQVDFDGHVSYSPVRRVEIDDNYSIQIYPNPLKKGDKLSVRLRNFSADEILVIEVFGLDMQRLLVEKVKVGSLKKRVVTLSTEQMHKGANIVRVTSLGDRKRTMVRKIIIE